MSRKEYLFDSPEPFLKKHRELLAGGLEPDDMELFYPHPVHGLEEKIDPKPSFLRFITLTGALTGLIGGFSFIIYTIFSWPLNTGGKPLISIPAFIIVAFEITILLGGVISFLGFLLLTRLPDFRRMADPVDYGNKFAIVVREGAES